MAIILVNMAQYANISDDANREITSKPIRSIEVYMKERVEFKINLYFRKARQYRFWHLIISIIVSVSAAIVPVLVSRANDQQIFLLAAITLSVVVSIGVALQEVFRFREHWRNYNMIDSNLRSEEMLFSMAAGIYKDSTSEAERIEKFVRRIEELISDERLDTITMRTSANRITENEKLIESAVESYLKSKKSLTG